MEDLDISISSCVELLIKWNFSEDVQLAFLNANVDLQEFLNMGLVRLQDFVPDSKERLRLITEILKYKTAQLASSSKETGDSEADKDITREDKTKDPDFDPDEYINSNNSESNQTSDSSHSEEEHQAQNKRQHTSKQQDGSAGLKSKTTSATASSETNNGSEQPSRLTSIIARNTFRDFDLKAYLERQKSRRVVFVGNKDGILTKSNRKLLTSILAEYILNHTYSPASDDFLIIREQIYKVFPGEPKFLYYAAPREISEHQVLAKGKLFDKVRNKIGGLIERGILAPRRKRKATVLQEKDSETESQLSGPSLDVEAALVVLKRSRQVTTEVEEKWNVTSEHRLKVLYDATKKSKSNAKKQKPSKENNAGDELDLAFQYFEEYKVLKHPSGYKLFLIDFKHMHSEESDNLVKNWTSFANKIEKIARSVTRVDDPVGKKLHEKILSLHKDNDTETEDVEGLDEDGRDALLLQMLPSLCPPTSRVRVGKKTLKPSTAESRNAFICHTTLASDLEALIERRRDRMATLKAPLQPYLVFVGPQLWNVSAAYVVVDRVLYHFDTVLQAVDTCYKIFHAACIDYPAEAKHLWYIFHEFLYGLRHNQALDGEMPNSTVEFLLTLKSV